MFRCTSWTLGLIPCVQGTDSKAKNELLFSRFAINYNDLPQQYRKGSVLARAPAEAEPPGPTEEENVGIKGSPDEVRPGRQRKEKPARPYEGLTGEVRVLHVDIIRDHFWDDRPWLLL